MESPRLSNDRTETLRIDDSRLEPDSPRLSEPNSPRIRRSASPSLGVKYNNMYSLSHASTSSSPHLQLPRTTVLRRASSSLSIQAISGLDDDSAEFDETHLDNLMTEDQYSESNHEHRHHHENHHSHGEKGKQSHIRSHENFHESGSHDHGYSHNANVKQLPSL